MRIALILFCFLLFSWLETSPIFYLLGPEAPELTLLLAASLGLLGGTMLGGISGLLSGFLLGLLSMHLFAVRALIYGLVGFLAGLSRGSLYLKNPLPVFLTGALAALLKTLILRLGIGTPEGLFSYQLLFYLLVNGVIILPIFYLLSPLWAKEPIKALKKW